MNVVYLLNVDVYADENEKEWLTGVTRVYKTFTAALDGFKLWCLDNYVADAMKGMTSGEHFTGNDVEALMEDEPVYLSWGINTMEVQG